MTKEELTERRNKAFQNIEEIKVALSLDEHYIDELEEKIVDIKANCDYVLEGKDVEIMELKENYYINRCLHSGCPYLHIDNRNCTKFGGFFTSVSNKDCPMMKNLNANIKLIEATKIIKDLLKNTSFLCSCKYEKAREIEKQAEQFIKDIK